MNYYRYNASNTILDVTRVSCLKLYYFYDLVYDICYIGDLDTTSMLVLTLIPVPLIKPKLLRSNKKISTSQCP